jgi:hypothetical protein
MNLNIQALETRVKQLAEQLQNSLANHNFLSGLKTEAERVLALLTADATKAVEADVTAASTTEVSAPVATLEPTTPVEPENLN